MKIAQERFLFKPITIFLESSDEAEALFGLVDKIDRFINEDDYELCFKQKEKDLIILLSNSRTKVSITPLT